jgi:hypothetical protein
LGLDGWTCNNIQLADIVNYKVKPNGLHNAKQKSIKQLATFQQNKRGGLLPPPYASL